MCKVQALPEFLLGAIGSSTDSGSSEVVTPEERQHLSSQDLNFLVALVAGVMMAFAFQYY